MDYRTYDISAGQGQAAGRRSAPSRGRGASMASTRLPLEELQFLDGRLAGPVVLPGHDEYDLDRRLFNRRFDPQPSAILHCMVERDVRLCLDAVRRCKTPFRVRAGGNSFAGYSASDGVVIDVSGLDDVCIDRAKRVATVGAGCSLAKLQAVLDEHALHLPLGDAKPVRVAGFMQGGGFGLTSRTYGMNSDHVAEVRVMLADGRIVRASEAVNHDLWWAVRGGTGGNFGVLLAARYRLRAAPALNPWSLGWRLSREADLDNAVSALMTLQEKFLRPRSWPKMNVSTTVLHLAERAGGPPKVPWLVMWGTYVGSESDVDSALEPLLRNPGCWPLLRPLLGDRSLIKFERCSRLVSSELRPEHWRSLLSHFLAGAPNRQSTLQIDAWGGAISSYPRESSAFIHRDTAFNIGVSAWWQHDNEEAAARAFLSGWSELLTPFWNGHIYQNFPSADAPDYRQNYWGAAYPALAAVKLKYDPDGLFVFPQAIEPGPPHAVQWPSTVEKWLRQPIKIERESPRRV